MQMTTIIARGVGAALRRFGYDISRHRDFKASMDLLDKEDTFTDSSGNGFQRLRGYRDLVKPDWREMFRPQPNVASMHFDSAGAMRQARAANSFLNKFGFDVAGKDVLEIGCHDGRNAYAMACLGARHVDAIDIPDYGVLQETGGEPDPKALQRQSRRLAELRRRCAEPFRDGCISDKVDFFDLDIVDLAKDGFYDLIVSWETLEHITDPKRAIANIHRALRPGGMSFHEYNSFFSLEGGHSLCTLDFPYGHAMLSADDFERYIRRYRPKELEVAMSFYSQCLNRMTIADLKGFCADAGLNILALCTWEDMQIADVIDEKTLNRCRELKPNLEINDLLSQRVWVLFQRTI